jgi:acetyltransferase-like isoleucine patch superfamily enzyme
MPLDDRITRLRLTEDLIVGRAWRFGTPNTTYAHSVQLERGGVISGYTHDNEASWKLENNRLALVRSDGLVTCWLSPDHESETIRLSGPFLGTGHHNIVHVLEEATQATISYPLQITWSKDCDAFFEKNRIYLALPFRTANVYAIGQNIVIPSKVLVEPYASMPAGGFYSSGAYSYCVSRLPSATKVGRYCSIAAGVSIMGDSHPLNRVSTNPVSYIEAFSQIAKHDFNIDYEIEPFQDRIPHPVTIENDVWIGEGALLKGGITIGTGAVIAARSVVTHNVPPYHIVGGVPEKLIRMRFDERTIERLLRSEWWKYNYVDLPQCWSEVDRFLDNLEDSVASGKLQPYTPELIDIGAELLRLSLR